MITMLPPAKKLAIFSFCILFIVSCSVGPDYESPQVALPKDWKQAEPDSTPQCHNELISYWEGLHDSVLNQLVNVGQQENLTLQEAALRVEEAFLTYGLSKAEYFPEIDLNGELQRRRRSAAIASAISNLRNDFVGVGGSLAWEIDILGRLRRLNESTLAELEREGEAYHGTLVSLQSEIALAYLRHQQRKAEIRFTKENIDRQRESLVLARDLFHAGIVPELDLRQAESNLGETQAALPLLRRALARETHQIAFLTSRFPEDVNEILKDSGQDLPTVPELTNSSLPLNIIRQRPDLRAAERALASQHARIGVAEAELYPIITLPGFFSFQALNSLESAFEGDSLAYSIGPRVDLNFIDFGRVRRGINREEVRTKQVEVRYRQAVFNAVREVEDALVALKEDRARSEYLANSVKASKRSTELVKDLYKSGLTDFQNVLDSERTLFSQQISYVEALGNTAQAYVGLFRALGGSWNSDEHCALSSNNKPSSVTG